MSGCERIVDGHELVHWIATVFGQCTYNGELLGLTAFWVGMSSLGFWICCQLPQFIENFRRKSASALSTFFILEWFSGDITNFVGAFLSNQLATQKMTAGLFCFMDCCMLSQMWYYNYYLKAPQRDTPGATVQAVKRARSMSLLAHEQAMRSSRDKGNDMIPVKMPTSERPTSGNVSSAPLLTDYTGAATSSVSKVGAGCGTAVLGLVVITVFASSEGSDTQLKGLSAARRLLDDDCSTTHLSHALQTTGTVLGWVSAVIYLNSRLPQVYKNWKSKSVEGLSALMFFCAVMGNLTYAAGVLIKASGWDDVNAAMPWLVGSVGTIIFDFIIVIQCFCYRNASDEQLLAGYLDPHNCDILENDDGSQTAGSLHGSGLYFTGGRNRSQSSQHSTSSMIQLMFDREGATPVYLDSGTQRLQGSSEDDDDAGALSRSAPV